MRKKSLGALAAVLSLAALLAGLPARAQEAAEPSQSQAHARQLLDAMARFLASQKEFGVVLRTGYEVMQASGQKIEFGSKRSLRLRRPGNLRIDTVAGDGTDNSLLFDGRRIVAYEADSNVYASAVQSASVDEAVVYYVRDLGMRLPLAPLLLTTFPAELERRVETIDFVGTTDLFGPTCHHVAGRTATVDFEAWIQDGKRPVLCRIALTYREEEGHPRFWAEFSDWDLDPDYRDSVFEFRAPEGAKPIAFATQAIQRSAMPQEGEAR